MLADARCGVLPATYRRTGSSGRGKKATSKWRIDSTGSSTAGSPCLSRLPSLQAEMAPLGSAGFQVSNRVEPRTMRLPSKFTSVAQT